MSVQFSPGFIFVAITTRQYKFTPFICWRKYFTGLIFIVEGDCQKSFRNKNFLIYAIWQTWYVCHHLRLMTHLTSMRPSKALITHKPKTTYHWHETYMFTDWLLTASYRTPEKLMTTKSKYYQQLIHCSYILVVILQHSVTHQKKSISLISASLLVCEL